ncbi:MAG: hypothetical protein ABJE66_11655 [Deltaproteobacteria bacterium]
MAGEARAERGRDIVHDQPAVDGDAPDLAPPADEVPVTGQARPRIDERDALVIAGQVAWRARPTVAQIGTPDDIAAHHLGFMRGGYVTGQALVVAGGSVLA